MVEEPRGDAKYRVGMVARLTGLSTHVLRVWERRYAAVVPTRTPKGGRLYTDADVARLTLLAELVADGHSIGAVAHLPVGELEAMRGGAAERSEGAGLADVADVRARFLERIAALDTLAAEQLLSKAAMALEPAELLARVVAPLLVEIGRRWEDGSFRIAHEHAATAMFRGLVGALGRIYGVAGRGTTVVAATPAGERHELGAAMAAMVAATLGHRVIYLGPDLPAAEIRFAVEASRAKVLLLSIACLEPAVARRELRRIVEGLPRGVRVFVGGAGAPEGMQGTKRLPSLEALADALRRGAGPS